MNRKLLVRMTASFILGVLSVAHPLFAQFEIKVLSQKHNQYPPDPEYIQVLGDSIYMKAQVGPSIKVLGISDGKSGQILHREMTINGNPIDVERVYKVKERLIILGEEIGPYTYDYFTYNPSDGTLNRLIAAPFKVHYWMPETDDQGNNYLIVSNGMALSLWKTDGTTGGTVKLFDYTLTPNKEYHNKVYAFDGNTFYYVALHPTLGYEIYKVNLSTGTEFLLKDVNPLNNTATNDSPKDLYVYDGHLYFTAIGSNQLGREPWVSDGTLAGTRIVGDLYFGSFTSNTRGFYGYKDLVYFSAASRPKDSISRGNELHVYDPAAHQWSRISDISPDGGHGVSNVAFYPSHDGRLIFNAKDSNFSATDLWITDGTSQGTVQWINATEFGDGNHLWLPTFQYQNGYTIYGNVRTFWAKNDLSQHFAIEDAANDVFPHTLAAEYNRGIIAVFNHTTQGQNLCLITLPVPDLGPDTLICPDAAYSLQLPFDSLKYKFEWSDGSNGVSLNIEKTGTYWVDLFNSDKSYYYGRDSVFVEIESIAFTLGPDTAVQFPYQLSLPFSGTYLWSTGSTDNFIFVNNPGSYSLIFTSAAGCVYKDTVTISKLSSISSPDMALVRIYPNPLGSGNMLTIESSGNKPLYSALLSNVLGIQLEEYVLNGEKIQIRLPALAPGTYILQLRFKDGYTSNQVLMIH